MADFYFGNLATGLVKRPAPESGMDASSVGETDAMTFTNGGAFQSNSAGTHREFNMGWGVQEKSVMNFLNEFRNGVYGTGLLYMVDPFATNHMPPHWANPGLTCFGWPSLIGPGVKPVRTDTVAPNPTIPFPAIPQGMPASGAKYPVMGTVGAVPERKLTLLIPADRDLHLGFAGMVTGGAALRMRTITRAGAYGPVSDLTMLNPAGTTRLNTKVSGAAYRAVQVYMTPTVPGGGNINLVSSKAIYALPTESPVLTGVHTEGEGHTGLVMEEVTTTYIQAARNRKLVSTAAKFTEIEAWL